MTDEQDAEARRHRYVTASSRRIWRITAVACAAILALGLGLAAVIAQQAQNDRERRAQQAEIRRDHALAAQQADDIACVRKWAIAYNNRAEQINGLSEARNRALDALLLAAIDRRPQPVIRRLAAQYRALVIQRRETLADNPLPPSPEFECGLTDRQHPAHPSPVATRDASPTPARPTRPPQTSPDPSRPLSSTRPASPARHDTSTKPGRSVAPGSGDGSVAPRPGRGHGHGHGRPSSGPPRTSPVAVHIPIPAPVCIVVRPVISTC